MDEHAARTAAALLSESRKEKKSIMDKCLDLEAKLEYANAKIARRDDNIKILRAELEEMGVHAMPAAFQEAQSQMPFESQEL